MKPSVSIKGIKEGLLITLGEGEWSELELQLLQQLDQQAAFLGKARLALDVGNHILKAVELGRLRDQISTRGHTLWCVIGESPRTQDTAQTLGLATRISKPTRSEQIGRALDTTLQGDQAVLVRRTLRSGYSLKFPGHVIVIGDVNPGAEIVAGGDVIIWGRLSGMVHAGATGDEAAIVCALDLVPTQLRIADRVAVPPKKRGKTAPEMAQIVDGQVQTESWNQNPKPKRLLFG